MFLDFLSFVIAYVLLAGFFTTILILYNRSIYHE